MVLEAFVSYVRLSVVDYDDGSTYPLAYQIPQHSPTLKVLLV